MQTKQNIETDVCYVFDKTEDLKTWYDYIRAKSRKEKKQQQENNNQESPLDFSAFVVLNILRWHDISKVIRPEMHTIIHRRIASF